MPPGMTRHSSASTTFCASVPSDPLGPTATIFSPLTATSSASVPVGLTTEPFTISRSYIFDSLSRLVSLNAGRADRRGWEPPPGPTSPLALVRRHGLRQELLHERLLAVRDLEDDERPVR